MIVNRLMHAADMTRDKEISLLLREAAETIESLQTWKIRWAEKDLAYEHLYSHFRLMRARLYPSGIDSLLFLRSHTEEEIEKLEEEGKTI